jgi:hypothetical protein
VLRTRTMPLTRGFMKAILGALSSSVPPRNRDDGRP